MKILSFASIAEGLTGVALIVAPSLVGQLLFGESLAETAGQVARVAGIVLLAFSATCWLRKPLLGMLGYSSAIAAYFSYIGLTDGSAGPFLWPAAAIHVVMSLFLGRALLAEGSR